MYIDLSETEKKYINDIVYEFEHCSSDCESCKCFEKINGTGCTFCELLLTYRSDIQNALNKLIEEI